MTHTAEQVRRLRTGVLVTLVVAAITGAIWGRLGVIDGLALGGVATAMQLLAARMMRRSGVLPSVDHLGVYSLGMLFRAMGVVVLALLTLGWPDWFRPGPSAVGYLGAVLPLLYLETRISR